VAEREFDWVLQCPCGSTLEAASEDGIVDIAFAHLREMHPEMVESYQREHILFMAEKYGRG